MRRTDVRRDSAPKAPELFRDAAEKAGLEARNALVQFDKVLELVRPTVQDGAHFDLRPSMLLDLHREAIRDIYRCAGSFRTSPIVIRGTDHAPPGHQDVPRLVEDMCSYVNQNWGENALHLAAYVMWRLNWIHPFTGGNGRVSRAASYLVLCARTKLIIPGRRTIAEQIVEKRDPYYAALDAADRAWSAGRPDVSDMERLLEQLLEAQLHSALEAANRTSTPKAAMQSGDGARRVRSSGQGETRSTGFYQNRNALIAAALGVAGIVATALITARCSSQRGCVPNEIRDCSPACAPGQRGHQTCDASGETLTACECREAPLPESSAR